LCGALSTFVAAWKREEMKIGGLQKVSLIDYPGAISAIIFSQGCNFQCPYCHNPELVNQKLFTPCMDEKEILDFLKTRVGKLDAVSITGGEPTIQNDLLPFIRQIKKLGYAVKLDSNASRPQVIQELLKENLLDYIALDIKAPLSKYESVVKKKIDSGQIAESIKLVLKAKIPHEFRTTVVESQLTENDLVRIAREISGAKVYVLQKFRPTKALMKHYLKENTYSDEEFEKIKMRLEKEITTVIIR
jgi:pyruvate formate lyase activating enzyme